MSNNNNCEYKNCSNKLRLSDLKCRCNKFYCKKHRLAELHECEYIYKKSDEENNTIIKKMKVESIKINKL